MMYLIDAGERDLNTQQFVQRWRDEIGEIPGADSLTFAYEVGVEPGKPIEIQLIHDDVPTLEAAAERLASEISSYSGLRDIDSGVTKGKDQLDFRLTDAALAQGLTEFELARQVRAAFFGAEAVRQQRGRDEVRVYVRLPLEERRSLYNVEELIVRTPMGGEMPLSQAAVVTRGQAYTVIKRTDGRRNISVTADVADETPTPTRSTRRSASASSHSCSRTFPGSRTASAASRSGRPKRWARSGWVHSCADRHVLDARGRVPQLHPADPRDVGDSVRHGRRRLGPRRDGPTLWDHVSLSLMSMMGLIALSGVVVNDSLILIVSINRYREAGMSTWEAVVAGGARRFRPILLTSLTTFFGLAPMILETSVQARFLVPMAVSLGFGVLAATMIMLLIVPCSYLILEDAGRTAGNFFARLAGGLPCRRHP